MAKYAEMEAYNKLSSRELLDRAAQHVNKDSVKEVPEKQDRKDKV